MQSKSLLSCAHSYYANFAMKTIQVVFLLLAHSVFASAFPTKESSCGDEATPGINPISIGKVEAVNGAINVSVSSSGTSTNPDYVVVVLTSGIGSQLEYLAISGGTGLRDNRSEYSAVDAKGNATIRFQGLSDGLGYSVHAVGYRCDFNRSGNGFKTKWVTKTLSTDGSRAVYTTGKKTGCQDFPPYIERQDLRKSGNSARIGSLFYVRFRNCGTAKQAVVPLIPNGIIPFSETGDFNLPPNFNILNNGSDDFNSSFINMYQHDAATFGQWNWPSGDAKGSWLNIYLYFPGDVPDLTWNIQYSTLDPKYSRFSIATRRASLSWVENVSKKLAGILQSTKDADEPLAYEIDNGLGARLRVISTIALQQYGISSGDGLDISAEIGSWWTTMKSLESSERITNIISPTGEYFPKWIQAGPVGQKIPDITIGDQSVSPYGWSIASATFMDGIPSGASIDIELTENIDLFVRSSPNKFIPITADILSHGGGIKKVVINLSAKVEGEPTRKIYDLLQASGLWIRANASTNGMQTRPSSSTAASNESSLEPYLIKACSGPLACKVVRGGVVRTSIFDERIMNTSVGLRRGNVAEMLPGETRNFTLRTDLILSSPAGTKNFTSLGCSKSPAVCPFSVSTSTGSNNSFSISSRSDAAPGQDSLYLDMRKSGSENVFVADVVAKIFGETQLLIVGGAEEVANDYDLRGYIRAGRLYAGYLANYGVATHNIRYVSCADMRDGTTVFDCTSASLNTLVSSFASPFQSKLSAITYFGHGSDIGYPVLRRSATWFPTPSSNSFAPDAKFANFSCHGALNGGLSAFLGAWGIKVIGNKYYTGMVGYKKNDDGEWSRSELQEAEDLVFFSQKTKPPKVEVKKGVFKYVLSIESDGSRRGLILNNPYKFVSATGAVDPNTGVVAISEDDYFLEDYPLFKVGSKLDFSVPITDAVR